MPTRSAPPAHAADLNLVIRHVLAGLGHGIHAGRERGAGVEFSEYRAYAPGDEWRRVDWKLLARADRYYVREAERDSHVAVWLWLDASASMAEPSRRVAGLDKLGFARTVLACVAAVAERQGDAFGLLVCGGERLQITPAARGARQLQRVLAHLARTPAAGAPPGVAGAGANFGAGVGTGSGTGFGTGFGTQWPGARVPGMIFAVGDFLDAPSPMAQALLRLRRMRHDVRVLCLQTEAERDADFPPGQAYRDPEHDAGLYRFGPDLRAAYRRARDAHFDALAAAWRRHDIVALSACIEQTPVGVLRAWLRQGGRR